MDLHAIFLQFVGLEESLPVEVEIHPACHARWTFGNLGLRPVGLRFDADPVGGPVTLSGLRLTPRRLWLLTGTDTSVFRLRVFVRLPRGESLVRGVVKLDGGATLELQTQWDLTTVLGSGSFCVDVGSP